MGLSRNSSWNRGRRCLFGSSYLLLLLLPAVAFSGEMYVQSIKTTIQAEPSLGSGKLAEVGRGTKLTVGDQQGGWYKVSHEGRNGWVSRLVLGVNPPREAVSILGGGDKSLETDARKRASTLTTAAAARGLMEDRARVNDKYRSDFVGVEQMEKLSVSDAEVQQFIVEGVGK